MLRPPLALDSLRPGLEFWNSRQNAAKLAKRLADFYPFGRKSNVSDRSLVSAAALLKYGQCPSHFAKILIKTQQDHRIREIAHRRAWLVLRAQQTMLDGNQQSRNVSL